MVNLLKKLKNTTTKHMENKNLTAVEWLIEQVHTDGLYSFKTLFEKEIEQAKQMEKEQIINAHGLKYYDLNEQTINGEQYYNETYAKRQDSPDKDDIK